jgi:hypothetical protein
MIFTRTAEYEDIKNGLDENDVITIITCQSCARVSGSGGENKMKELAIRLRGDGYNVKEGYSIRYVCSPSVLYAKVDKDVSAIISLACNAGTSSIHQNFRGRKVVQATRDVGLMVADSDKKILKVTLPIKRCQDELGQEYKVHTGEKMHSNNNLLNTEVSK